MPGQLMRRREDVQVGDVIAPQQIALTPTRIIAAAIATRDYQPVHHDVDVVKRLGNAGIFLNTHTTAGFLECYVQAWAGPEAFVKSVKFRLGIPSYAGDTLTLAGEIAGGPEPDGSVAVKVIGTNALGVHVEGEVVVRLAGT